MATRDRRALTEADKFRMDKEDLGAAYQNMDPREAGAFDDDEDEDDDVQYGEEDSDVDDIDPNNFKGIYFGDDPNKKYTCPETGAHF